MLLKFRVKNYRSFYDEAVIDMTATSQREHEHNIINKDKIKILPTIAIHGPNAAGKTNILYAIYFMFRIMIESPDYDIDKGIPISPFIFSDEKIKEPIEFELFLLLNGTEYQYGFVADREKIYEEWLYYKSGKTIQSNMKPMFEREFQKIQIKDREVNTYKELSSVLDKKMLFLSILARKNVKHAVEIVNWCKNSFFSDEGYINRENICWGLLKSDQELKETCENMLKEIDSSIKELIINEKENEKQEKFYDVYTKHIGADKEEKDYTFFFNGESAGTKKIMKLLPIISMMLKTGGLLLIDELDTQLHPLLYRKLVQDFYNEEKNTGNAQLIFTTHNIFLMDNKDLRRDQMYLVEKDLKGKSSIYAISDFKNVRYDCNIAKKYLSGRLGGIPNNLK